MPCWATHDQAAEAMRKSGLGAAPAGTQLMFGGFWATAADGFRFTSPRILRPEPGIQVAQGYDFADLAFITTSGGVVAIDAGTTQDRVKAALGDLDPPADGAISHLILTHAHWDHIGGAGALAGPGTRVIAQAGFPAGLDREQGDRPRFRYFTGAAGDVPPAVVPDQLISEPTPLTAGGTELVLYPAPGGETSDALMVHLPASGVLFTGDVLMPYLGQPFAGEGSPEGLLAGPRLHRQPAAPPAHPRPHHADRAVHRRGGPRPAGGADPAARRGAGRHPRRPHPPRHPGCRPASRQCSASTLRRSCPTW